MANLFDDYEERADKFKSDIMRLSQLAKEKDQRISQLTEELKNTKIELDSLKKKKDE